MTYFSTRRHLCGIWAVVFSAAIFSGCEPASSTSLSGQVAKSAGSDSSSKSKTETAAKSEASAPAPYLSGWDKPAVALLLSGEQHGYLEPCGCTELQSGGVARRADLVRILEEDKKWDVVGLDVGGTLKRSRRQDQIKFEKLFEAFDFMHYAAVGVGVEELKLGADYLLQRIPVNPEQVGAGLVSANVVLFDQEDLGWPLHYRIIEKGGVKIGVTSVLGLSLKDKIAPAGVETNIKVLDPDKVLPGVIAKLEEQKPDLMILLSHGSDEEGKQFAKTYPQFKLVLSAGGYEEPDGKPIEIGKTWLLNVGHKGKRVGVLGFYPNNAEHPFRFELIQLDKERFQNHPAMRQLMKMYQKQLEDEDIAASDDLLISQHPSGHTFVGAEKCAGCHSKAHEQWKDTAHAFGFKTLKEGPWNEKRAAERVDWIPRQFDPECLSCHVTGWHPQEMLRYGSGYIREQQSPHLLGQQCENCHGPASLHVQREEGNASMDQLAEGRKTVRRTLEEARRTMCIQCHDPDNSPTFTPERFDKFWEEVKHPWKD